jgi:MFS family permease
MSSFLPVLTPTLERGRITAPPLLGPSRPRRLRASLDASVAEGAAAEVFGACAGGAVLTGWALYLGASAVTIGLLTALPVAAQVLQLPAAWLTQRLGAKPLAVASIGTSRLVWLPMLAVPFLGLSDVAALATFVMVVTVASILGVVGNNAWTAWMGDLVPGAIRGRFFSRRLIYINVAGTLATLVAGAISIWLLLVQQGPVHADATPPRWADLARSVRDPRTRPLLGYFLAWHAAVGISAGFFSYHMLANLEMGFVLVAAHAILVAAVRVASAPAWGRLVDGFGARPVLVVCSVGISLVPVIWLFVTPTRLWPIAIEALVAGVLWGGHGIAAFDLSIGLAPRHGRPFYLAAFATAGGIGFAVTSGVAALLAWMLAAPLHVGGAVWLNVHVLFLLSALGRAGAAWLALSIDEPAARSVRELARTVLGMVARGSTRMPRPVGYAVVSEGRGAPRG